MKHENLTQWVVILLNKCYINIIITYLNLSIFQIHVSSLPMSHHRPFVGNGWWCAHLRHIIWRKKTRYDFYEVLIVSRC